MPFTIPSDLFPIPDSSSAIAVLISLVVLIFLGLIYLIVVKSTWGNRLPSSI